MGNQESDILYINDAIGQEITVGRKNVRIKKHLSEGGMGHVFLVTDTSDQKEYALKRVFVSKDNEDMHAVAKWEMIVYEKLGDNANIVQRLASKEIIHKNGDSEYILLMEYCNGGTLLDLVNRQLNMGGKDIVICFSQICLGLAHLHTQSPPICHRDIKLENILLSSAVFKLCDFGSSAYCPVEFKTKEQLHLMEEFIEKHTSSIYRAPEMCDLYGFHGVIDEKADIWGLGCVFFTLLFHTHPFETGSKNAIVSGHFSIPAKHRYPSSWIQLLNGMLTVDPKERYSIETVYSKLQSIALALNVKIPPLGSKKFVSPLASPINQPAPDPIRKSHRPDPIFIASPNTDFTSASSSDVIQLPSRYSSVSLVSTTPQTGHSQTRTSSSALLMAPAGGLYSAHNTHPAVISSTFPSLGSASMLMQPAKNAQSTAQSHVSPVSPTKSSQAALEEFDKISLRDSSLSVSSVNEFDEKKSKLRVRDSKAAASLLSIPENHDTDPSSTVSPEFVRNEFSFNRGGSETSYTDFQDSASEPASAENNSSFYRYNLSFLSFADDITRSIYKCTDESLTNPKSKYVRKLIIISWDRGGVPDLFQILNNQPILEKGVVALKSLEMIHKLLLDGHHSIAHLLYLSRDFFIKVRKNWLNFYDNPRLFTNSGIADMICAYSTFLLERAQFHRVFPAYEGNFALSIFMKNVHNAGYVISREKWWQEQCKAMIELVKLIGLAVDLGERCIATSSLSDEKYPDEIIEFRQQFIISVIDVLHMMFFAASYVLMLVCRMRQSTPADTLDLVTAYQKNYSRMQKLFGSRVQQLPIVIEKKRQITCPDQLPNPFKARDVLPPMSNSPQLVAFNQKLSQHFANYMLNGIRSTDNLEQDSNVASETLTRQISDVPMEDSISAPRSKSKSVDKAKRRASEQPASSFIENALEKGGLSRRRPSLPKNRATSFGGSSPGIEASESKKFSDAIAVAQATIGAYQDEIKRNNYPQPPKVHSADSEFFSGSLTEKELESGIDKKKDEIVAESEVPETDEISEGVYETEEGDDENADVYPEVDPFNSVTLTEDEDKVDLAAGLLSKTRYSFPRNKMHRKSIPSISSVKDLFLFSGTPGNSGILDPNPALQGISSEDNFSLGASAKAMSPVVVPVVAPPLALAKSADIDSKISSGSKPNSLSSFLDIIGQTKTTLASIAGTTIPETTELDYLYSFTAPSTVVGISGASSSAMAAEISDGASSDYVSAFLTSRPAAVSVVQHNPAFTSTVIPHDFSVDSSKSKLHSVDPNSDDTEMDYSSLTLGERIGIGAFAEVFKGRLENKDVAIKRLLANNQTPDSIAEFWSEVKMMRKLKHENIVAFYAACKNPACVVTELLEGNLWDLLHNSSVELPVQLRLRMLVDAAHGMEYLHSFQPPIVHRDLKSANLLYDKNFRVKVGDFGLSRSKDVQYTMTGQCGTFQWMSPEVMQSQRYTEKADIFSFGVIIWEILFRQIPYAGMNSVQVSIAVITQSMRPPVPSDTPPELSKLMQDCWNTNPSQRPVFPEIIARLKEVQAMFGDYS